jgi:hypothetical protein
MGDSHQARPAAQGDLSPVQAVQLCGNLKFDTVRNFLLHFLLPDRHCPIISHKLSLTFPAKNTRL